MLYKFNAWQYRCILAPPVHVQTLLIFLNVKIPILAFATVAGTVVIVFLVLSASKEQNSGEHKKAGATENDTHPNEDHTSLETNSTVSQDPYITTDKGSVTINKLPIQSERSTHDETETISESITTD